MEIMLENDIAHRIEQNPLLKPADFSPLMENSIIECLLNPGVFEYEGRVGLLLRVAERPVQKEGFVSFPVMDENNTIHILEFEESHPDLDLSDARVISYKGKNYLTTLSYLKPVFSDDGINFYEDPNHPPLLPEGKDEAYGIEDCRVVKIDDKFHLTYTKVSSTGVGVGYISTSDWKNYERHGMIFPAHNKDCAIFEEKCGETYYALHRPSSPELGGNYIWIAESKDLLHWGNHKCIAATRQGKWDCARVGAGAAPIKTEKGWLEIYHGANYDHKYCLGALLLDLEDPSIVLARSEEPIMVPQAEYELTGFFGNVVFTNGHIVKGDQIQVYYGASDEVVCRTDFSIDEILNTLLSDDK
ncbi:glycoside hydrolase family 130 protein [Aureibacter tunicatorum]|nr:glycoside hydrolase family 130 protein [Aureibacter tunicatorum]BDD07017.1 glycosidase [Aureibacter tunicatorum]